MRKDFEIEVGKQKTVLTGSVEFTGENDKDCDGPLVRFYVESVYVGGIHTVTDHHKRCDIVTGGDYYSVHKTSDQRAAWFAMAEDIAKNKIDFLALLSK